MSRRTRVALLGTAAVLMNISGVMIQAGPLGVFAGAVAMAAAVVYWVAIL